MNTGLYGVLLDEKKVDWVSCGHDHDNDFVTELPSVKIAYGRKTGYGSYGPAG